MNKKLTVLVLTGAMACAMALPAMAAGNTATPTSTPVSAEISVSLPDSVLYYGTVQEIVKDAEGNITQLRMNSERYGAYVMNLTDQTVWIDSGRRTASERLRSGKGRASMCSTALWRPVLCRPSPPPLLWFGTSPWTQAALSTTRWRRFLWRMAS